MSYGSIIRDNVRKGICLSSDYYRQYIIISAMQRMYMTNDISVHSKLDKWNLCPALVYSAQQNSFSAPSDIVNA
jgi:hypothetical protein